MSLDYLGLNYISPQCQFTDFFFALWASVVLWLVRVVVETAFLGSLETFLKRLNSDAAKKPHRVLDDIWIAIFSGALTAFAWYVMVYFNYECTVWSISTCVKGFEDHPYNFYQRSFFLLMFAYYNYEMISTLMGKGTILKFEMVAHHLLTMLMIIVAYEKNLMRYGLMSMALLDLSNPILHSAKTLNAIGTPSVEKLKWLVFNFFALVFFIARIVTPPFSMLPSAVIDGFASVPFEWALACNMMVFAIYALQIFWFYKIIQIARGKGSKDD